MSIYEYWEAVASGKRQGLLAAGFRAGLSLGSLAARLILDANLGLYSVWPRRRVHLHCPVLAVGNLTLGGTGKTTTTAYLVRRLAEAGLRAGVILRGYRRTSGRRPLLVSDGERILASPDEAGDEAVMLARTLRGHPVAVGLYREQVGRLLLDQQSVDALVLDDGFQYFRLYRDADIVLVDASHSIESDKLFPAGRLREPHRHLQRASQIWITHSELVQSARVDDLRRWIAQQAPGLPIVVTRHRGTEMRPLGNGAAPPPGAKVVALSALGNPRSFEAALSELGYEVVPIRFDDHHSYSPADWDRIRTAAQQAQAQYVLTTEKDAVKLPPVPGDLPPVHALNCELGIVDGHQVVDELIEAIGECVRAGSTLSVNP